MKRYIHIFSAISLVFLLATCEQEFPVIPPPGDPDNPIIPPPPSAGNADFTKHVMLGNSLTVGFQGNALFDMGQMNSLGVILSRQFSTVGGGEFIQPDIDTENGFNSLFSDLSDPNPANWVVKRQA